MERKQGKKKAVKKAVKAEVKKEVKAVKKEVKREVKKDVKRKVRAPRAAPTHYASDSAVRAKQVSKASRAAKRQLSFETASYTEALMATFQHPQAGIERPAVPWDTVETTVLPGLTPLAPHFQGSDAAPGVGNFLPKDEILAVMKRSPLAPWIVYDYGIGYISIYRGFMAIPGNDVPALAVTMHFGVGKTYIPVSFLRLLSDTGCHGPFVPSGVAANQPQGRFFLMQNGDQCDITLGAGGASGFTVQVGLDQWTSEGVQEVVRTDVASDDPTGLTAPQLGYFAPWVSVSGADSTGVFTSTLSLQFSYIAGGRFTQLMDPSIVLAMQTLSDVKLVGQSFLYQNQATELNQGGGIRMVQLRSGVTWLDYVPAVGQAVQPDQGSGPYGKIGGLKQTVSIGAEKGCYGWRKPDGANWSDWTGDVQTKNLQLADARYHIDLSGDILFSFNLPPVAQIGNFEFANGLEATTEDRSRVQKVSRGTIAATQMAEDAIRLMPQFSHNPDHWGMIWGNIKAALGQVGQAVVKWGPLAAEVAGALL